MRHSITRFGLGTEGGLRKRLEVRRDQRCGRANVDGVISSAVRCYETFHQEGSNQLAQTVGEPSVLGASRSDKKHHSEESLREEKATERTSTYLGCEDGMRTFILSRNGGGQSVGD